MTRRPYLTPDRLVEVAQSLGPDEHFILRQLATMRLATARQLQQLAGVDGDAAIRRFRRRLARMTEVRLLGRLERSIGGVRAGSAGFVYRLDLAGQRLVAPGSPGHRPWTPRPSWLAHALTVSQVYVELAVEPVLKLLTFEAEPTCWRSFTAGYRTETLKPDAYLEMALGNEEVLVFLEVDQGTESSVTLGHKLDTYYRYWQSGGAEQTGGVMPLVLWAVPDNGRRRVVQQVIESRPVVIQAVHYVTLQSDVVSCLATLLSDSSTSNG